MGRVHVAIDLRILDRVGIERTGIGRHALEATRALRAARPHWRLTLESNRADLFAAAGDEVELRPTRWPTGSSLGRVSWLEAGYRRGAGSDADLWLAPTFFLPRAQRGPSIVLVHDLVFAERPDLYRGRANAWYATRSARSAMLRADLVLCATRALRERIVEWAGIVADRVRVIPWGGVEDAFRAPSAAAAPEEAYWLFAGRWEARKGIEVLAAARAEAAARGAPSSLVLVGSPGRGAAEAIAALRRESDVTIERDPGDERLADLYRSALALVYPSLIEGFGLPVAEAMAAGCPVIASDLAEVREWASDAPRYVPAGDPQSLADAMCEIAADPERRRQMVDRGLAVARRLSWDRVGEAIAQAVEAVLAERASSA